MNYAHTNEKKQQEKITKKASPKVTVFDEIKKRLQMPDKKVSHSNKSNLHCIVIRQTINSKVKQPLIQTKLKIGQPNDLYEQEADRVADQIIKTPESKVGEILAKPTVDKITPLVQKQGGNNTPTTVSDIESLQGKGRPLSTAERNFFEPRFGYNFENVRIFDDHNADIAARSVKARAFTIGTDIVFRSRAYIPENHVGKLLIAHELTHVIQQGGGSQTHSNSAYLRASRLQGFRESRAIHPPSKYPAQVVQRDLEEAFLEISEDDRPFESGEQGLQQFQSIITDYADFENVALSYGMRPAELLAVYMQEGGLMQARYSRPSLRHVPEGDRTALVAYYLWDVHGMDDFASTYPKRSPECRAMGITDDNCPNWTALGSRLLHQLSEIHSRGLLWDSLGFRPSDPDNQLSPVDAASQLTSCIESSGLPNQDFVRFVYRLVAASIAMRQMVAPRSRFELRRLGLSETDISGEDVEDVMEILTEEESSSDTEIVYPEVEALLTVMDTATDTTPRTPSRRLGFRYRELELAQQQLDRARRRGDQRAAEQLELNIRDLMERAFARRFPVAVARLSMGTSGGFLTVLSQVHGQFLTWNRPAYRESREALYRWALDKIVLLISSPSEDEAREEIESSINEETVPLRNLRTVLTNFVGTHDFNSLRVLFRFIVRQVKRYAHIDNTQDWIEALTDRLPTRGVIPIAVYNHLTPPVRLAALPEQLQRSMRRFGAYRRFSESIIQERLQRERQ